MRFVCAVFALSVFALVPIASAKTTSEQLEAYLTKGQIEQGIKFFKEQAAEKTPEAQYAVGMLQLLSAVEGLSHDLYKYGLKPESPDLPFLRLPLPVNPEPEKLTYNKWRKLLQDFVEDLGEAQSTLATIKADEVKIKVPFGLIRLDLDGNGKATKQETLWVIFAELARVRDDMTEDDRRFEIGFDKADVHWMIGYTHLLQAMAEAWLAHDTKMLVQATAPMFFDGADSSRLAFDIGQDGMFDPDSIVDAIAAIHLIRFEVVEPERMRVAHKHLHQMIAESRLVWAAIDKETDDDREWIPGPKQTSITPLRVEQQQMDGWKLFLDEAEAVLAGKKLLPHWRVQQKNMGINLKRVFTHPRKFDLVMWVHGAAAVPYLQTGKCITQEDARTLERMFGGNFFAFAIWFN